MRVYVDGIGLLGPGFGGWTQACAVFRGETAYATGATARPSVDLLPPAERRRCGDTVRLAVHVGVEAVRASGADAARLAAVFASSAGHGAGTQRSWRALARADR